MNGCVAAVGVAPAELDAGRQLIRELRERRDDDPAVEVTYPPALEALLLARELRCTAEAESRAVRLLLEELAAGEWAAAADYLLIPRYAVELVPAIIGALRCGQPVLVVHDAAAERTLGNGVAFVSDPRAVTFLAAIQELAAGSEPWEAAVRRGQARARHLARLHAETPPSVAAENGQRCESGPLPGVTVIVPTTGGERVRRSLRALRRAAGRVPLQVIMVIAGGLAGSLPACDEIVRCEPPFSWAKANNAGLGHARFPYVLCLNDDCYFLRAGDLERLVRRLENCGHLIAVGPVGQGFPTQWEQSTLPARSGLHPTRFTLCGACFLVRREAFWSVGGFEERFSTYGCDEMDWFYRARAAGYRWAIDADVAVEHEGAATYGLRAAAELPASSRLFRELHGVPDVDGPHWDPPRRAVSWVIASRNNAGHLARCLGSIAAQRSLYPPGPEGMEVVLALDGCTDASAAVATAFNAGLDEPLPLRIVSFPEPAGSPARAKNRALRLARGEVILPLDDDDAALPARAQLVAALQAPGEATEASGSPPARGPESRGSKEPLLDPGGPPAPAPASALPDVAVGDFWVIGLDGSVSRKEVGPVTWPELLRSGAQNWGLWATAIRREALDRYGYLAEDRRSTEDLDFWLRWLRDGARFSHIPEPVHLYLLRPGSIVFTHDTLTVEEEIRQSYRDGRGTRQLGLQTTSPYRLKGEFAFPPQVGFEAWQRPEELALLRERFVRLLPRRILEIGTARGGTLRAWLEHAPDGAVVVSVDLPAEPYDFRPVFQTWVPAGVQLHALHGSSHDLAVRATVASLLPDIDFLFIDGDHSYAGVMQDLAEYGPLVGPGGLVALHDIQANPERPDIEVPRCWAELRSRCCAAGAWCEELASPPGSPGGGIGLIEIPPEGAPWLWDARPRPEEAQ